MKDVVAVVAAAANSRGIGYEGRLPWKLPGDMAHFRQVTSTPPAPHLVNAVIMGRKTWESIPPKFRPLAGRTNLVLTTTTNVQGATTASSWKDALQQLQTMDNLGTVFVIGGAQVYQQAIEQGIVNKVIYTNVLDLPDTQPMDAFFPELPNDEWECHAYHDNSENHPENTSSDHRHKDQASGLSYEFLEYTRRPKPTKSNVEEMQYLNLCRDILDTGNRRGDRTGTGTISKFGTQMRFSLRNGQLPLLTTKRTFWRGVAEELLWFVRGSTNANLLKEKGIHIWDGNASREFLDSRGLHHRQEGDLGPVYGFQWRHFGAKYVDMHTDYTGQGVDQLAACIDKIQNHPEDRRILLSAWNPADLDLMALPPCHMFCQFYVNMETNELSCQMYQRSADMGLGVPFNIASYALLTHMVAHVTGRKPGEFVHTIGDAHIYTNHVEALEEQLTRTPRAFPTLHINPDKRDIDDFVFEDFTLEGYNPHKSIPMKMAV